MEPKASFSFVYLYELWPPIEPEDRAWEGYAVGPGRLAPPLVRGESHVWHLCWPGGSRAATVGEPGCLDPVGPAIDVIYRYGRPYPAVAVADTGDVLKKSLRNGPLVLASVKVGMTCLAGKISRLPDPPEVVERDRRLKESLERVQKMGLLAGEKLVDEQDVEVLAATRLITGKGEFSSVARIRPRPDNSAELLVLLGPGQEFVHAKKAAIGLDGRMVAEVLSLTDGDPGSWACRRMR